MALHGEIKVNGTVIAEWEARRTHEVTMGSGPVEGDPIYLYDCRYTSDGEAQRFTIMHRYKDGAAALASRVISDSTNPNRLPEVPEAKS